MLCLQGLKKDVQVPPNLDGMILLRLSCHSIFNHFRYVDCLFTIHVQKHYEASRALKKKTAALAKKGASLASRASIGVEDELQKLQVTFS